MIYRAHSRLAQRRQSKNLRQALVYAFLSLVLIFSLIFLGLPILIRVAVFLGNLKNSSVLNEPGDILPPAPPSLFSYFTATSSALINLQGFAESGSSIEVFLNGLPEKKIVAEANGEFVLGNLKLNEGRNEIYAIATDKSGNPSQKSALLAIVLDQISPKLSLNQPPPEQIFYFPQKTIEIKGETDGNTLTINDHWVTIDSQGKFNYPYLLKEGENNLKIVVTDLAGNQTEQEIKVYLK